MLIFAHMTDSISTLASIPTLAGWDPKLTNILIALFLMVSIAMILLVLIQRPQGGGLSGAFGSGGGGGGAGQTAFGTKTGDVLTWATIGIFITFLSFAVVLNFATRPDKPSDFQPVLTAPANADQEGESLDLSGALDGLIEDAEESTTDTDAPATDSVADPASEPEADLPANDG